MTPRYGIPRRVTGTPETGPADREVLPPEVPFPRRMWARLFAARYDHEVERQVTVTPGTPLAAHYVRLTSRRERDDMAHALTQLLRHSGRTSGEQARSLQVPVCNEAIRQSSDLVDDVVARLRGPLRVRARGMARLRILLGDGRGPVYRSGRGTLTAAMRGVLAAL